MKTQNLFKRVNEGSNNGLTVFATSPTVVKVDGHAMQMYYIQLTAKGAEKLLQYTHYEKQRGLKFSNLDMLYREMNDEAFVPFSMIILAHEDGQFFLIDGNHRLNALMNTGGTTGFWLQVIESDLSKDTLYSVLDSGRERTNYDGLHALGTFDEFESKYRISTVGAVKKIYAGMESNAQLKRSAVELDRLMQPWLKLAREYFSLINKHPNAKHMRSTKLVSVGMLTLRYQPEKARCFWSGIAQDDGLAQDDPRKYIVKQFGEAQSPLKLLNSIYEHEAAMMLSRCWNAYYEGKTLKRFVYDKNAKVALLGTPYDPTKPNCGL